MHPALVYSAAQNTRFLSSVEMLVVRRASTCLNWGNETRLAAKRSTMKKYLPALLFLPFLHAAAAPIPQSPLAAHLAMPFGLDANVTFNMPDHSLIALIGEINATSVDSVTRILPGATAPKTLYIDSQGGDLRAAFKLADFVREHGIRVVVVGRCFSACAHYVFSGARRKDALPGSLIGIHSNRFGYQDVDKYVALNTSSPAEQARIMTKPGVRRQFEDVLRLDHEFHAKTGISTRLLDAYAAFDTARGRDKAAAPAKCRNVDLWILTRPQLESMGVKGFGTFWAPASLAEARSSAAKLGLREDQIFFGSPEELADLCKPTLMERLRAFF